MLQNHLIGAFILRIFLGSTFFIHGLTKFQGGIENTAGFFHSLGLPGFTAYAVAIIELVGGLAMILGFGTRIVAVLFAFVMAGAIVKVKLAAGFLGNGQMAGYELDLALLAISIYFVVAKESLFSIDQKFSQSE
ncbi:MULTISPECIES: DoxX family protein [unclassified Rossellomorea]|uniref:DoxX family protein n=1 Tax=unclassified Rossellomorea TaxID=2837526 RepID=UPI00263450B8|nr:DoxX family protein [uncultured Rossellomorea sp.]